MHFVDFTGVDSRTLASIIDLSLEIKKDPDAFRSSLAHKRMYMLFEKTSTRTALSFAIGMNELGGIYYQQNWGDSNFCVADIQDEVRYVSRNVDIIMARLKQNQAINLMAQYATVPVINGCCDKFHPCQAMADIMTLREIFGGFQVKLLYVGILNNVFNSLATSLPQLGGELISVLPIINPKSFDQTVLDAATATGRYRNIATDSLTAAGFRDLLHSVDAVYVDTWVDMEFFNEPHYQEEKARRIRLMQPYQLNQQLLQDSKCIVLHDMPMHPGYEITRETIEAHIDTILQQAENRRHAQKGILLNLLSAQKVAVGR